MHIFSVCVCVCVCMCVCRVQGQLFHMDCDLSFWSEVHEQSYQPTLTLLFGTRARCLPSASSAASPHRPSSMSSTSVRRLCDSVGLIADTTLYYVALIYNFIVRHIKESCVLTDLPGQAYWFPVHIAATDEQPDIVIWSDHQCTLVELTVPFEDNFADAECRKGVRACVRACVCTFT